MNVTLFFALFVVGLLGSTHCMGMCGGLQQLFINIAPDKRPTTLLIYHCGRLSSYALITLLTATLLSRFAEQTQGFVPYANLIRLLAALLMIWLGLKQLIRLPAINRLTLATDKIWQTLRKFAKPFLPPKNRLHVFIVGLFWGWLPCSLVYSALAIALSGEYIITSVVAMSCFGLGTMPALLGMGVLAQHLQKNPQMKQWLAALLVALGVYALVSIFI